MMIGLEILVVKVLVSCALSAPSNFWTSYPWKVHKTSSSLVSHAQTPSVTIQFSSSSSFLGFVKDYIYTPYHSPW